MEEGRDVGDRSVDMMLPYLRPLKISNTFYDFFFLAPKCSFDED